MNDEKINFKGIELPVQKLSKPIITCEDAAAEKGTDIRNELKSLLLTAVLKPFGGGERTTDFYVLTIRGDLNAYLKRIFNTLKSNYTKIGQNLHDLRMATEDELGKFDTMRGVVNPISEKLSGLPQIVSFDALLQGGKMSVMANEHDKYVNIDPIWILQNRKAIIGDFNSNAGQLNDEFKDDVFERLKPMLIPYAKALERNAITEQEFAEIVKTNAKIVADKLNVLRMAEIMSVAKANGCQIVNPSLPNELFK